MIRRSMISGVLVSLATLVAGSGHALGQAAPDVPSSAPTPAPTPDELALLRDASTRMTVKVEINGQGPYPFIIDTGADRTVISRELAGSLDLKPGAPVDLVSTGGVDRVQTAAIDSLKVGARTIRAVDAPVLAAHDLGAEGMLGLDSLAGQRIVMDFKTGLMESVTSQADHDDDMTVIVRARSRYGGLILVDAKIRGVAVYVILDTGSQSSIGNSVLRSLLRRNGLSDMASSEVVSVTGRHTPVEIERVGRANIGPLVIDNMALAFADLSTFSRFHLEDKPALLLGMDVLALCKSVSIDFARREVAFELKS